MTLKLHGKYKDRNDNIVTIIGYDENTDTSYPFLGDNGIWYVENGFICSNYNIDDSDLIEEITEEITEDTTDITSSSSSSIECTLETRQSTHGDFSLQALTSQSFKDICRLQPNWSTMSASHKESIDMILHKIARILSGDPDFVDSWRDIEGYSALVRKQLESSGAKDVRQEYFNH